MCLSVREDMCHCRFLYKTNVVEGKWISLLLSTFMLPKFGWTMFYLWELGFKAWERVEALPCEASLELLFYGFLCVSPLWLGGLMGKKSTPNVGWEVLMNFFRLVSKEDYSEGIRLVPQALVGRYRVPQALVGRYWWSFSD
jgi:hypothetical protein